MSLAGRYATSHGEVRHRTVVQTSHLLIHNAAGFLRDDLASLDPLGIPDQVFHILGDSLEIAFGFPNERHAGLLSKGHVLQYISRNFEGTGSLKWEGLPI